MFREGTHHKLYERLGAHLVADGCHFAVWAPAARSISVIGDFDDWTPSMHPLEKDEESGIWTGSVRGVREGAVYKYRLASRIQDYTVDKADPFAFRSELPPATGSIVWGLDYDWRDRTWMTQRGERHRLDAPSSIYEVHLGSWRRREDGQHMGYRELADALVDYVGTMGFTHVELLPVMEHPYYPSWGYQLTGYFAPTGRYGTPQDFMYFVDRLHQSDIGVILDWVPSHFPSDAHGLGFFDGTYLYEHADPRKRIQPDWDSLIFNYSRREVRSFLLSSALFWLDRYHIDGLRVDAVASMLYLDYSRDEGEWEPNVHGGRENLEAIEFLRSFNESAYKNHPDLQTIAEESTAWPMVSHPTYVGGLGFGLKWDMGWMHDTLDLMKEQPEHRKFHHERLTFRPMYAFSENFVLALSHDEVVHGKGSLLRKMPGDEWRRFANLRLLVGYMWAQPGKKLLFMGGEFGQVREWDHDGELDWPLLETPYHAGMQSWVRDVNALYLSEPALHEQDCSPAGFEWVNCENRGDSVLSFLRRGKSESGPVLIVLNFGTSVHHGYRVGAPNAGHWEECLNSDAEHYGGSGQGNLGRVDTEDVPADGHALSVAVTLPALAAVFFRWTQPRLQKRTPATKAGRKK